MAWERAGRSQVDEEIVVYLWHCEDCGDEVELERGRPKPCPCARTVRPGEVVTYTTAEAAYDWFGTHEIAVAGTSGNGKPVRKVAGPANRVESQRARYGSGCHLAVPEEEWRKLVSYGLATEAPATEAPATEALGAEVAPSAG